MHHDMQRHNGLSCCNRIVLCCVVLFLQVPPAVQCELVYEMASRFKDGSVYAGSDWFDGSHIVCNDTAAAAAAAAASSTSR